MIFYYKKLSKIINIYFYRYIYKGCYANINKIMSELSLRAYLAFGNGGSSLAKAIEKNYGNCKFCDCEKYQKDTGSFEEKYIYLSKKSISSSKRCLCGT